jgi:hypothetical protein
LESILVLKTALRHDTIRRAIEVTGRVSSADLKDGDDGSVLSNLKGNGLAIKVVRPNAK